MGCTVAANLKESCRALELPVGGSKADLVRRLASAHSSCRNPAGRPILEWGAPTANQVEEVKNMRQARLARGLD